MQIKMQEKLNNAIKAILNGQSTEMVGFPVFMYWALLYSPDLIKAKINVTEKKWIS